MSIVEVGDREASVEDNSAAGAAATSLRRGRGGGLGRVTGSLTVSNTLVALVGIVTGPLQARALGPAGRGELAAIFIPFLLLPTIASVGLGSYVVRAVARGRRPGTALGSLLPVSLGIGVVVAVASPLIAGFLADGRTVVYTMLIVGLILFPIGMLTNMLIDSAIGLEDWRPVIACRVIPPAAQLIGIPVLFYTQTLTVTSAALLTFGAGMLIVLPLIRVWRQCLPLNFDLAECRAGVAYGSKCWLGGLSNIANARLDQLLMIRLVSSSVLGLYAVAVTLATFFISPVIAAISTAATPRMARGEQDLTRRLCRMTICGAALVGIIVATVSPFVVHYIFGRAFDPALPMALILLIGTVPNAAGGVLNTSVSAHGHPGKSARGEGLALIVTVAGLAIALPTLGGVGAALVSVVAYSTQFIYMLRTAKRMYGGRYREYFIVSRAEAMSLLVLASHRARLLSPKRLRSV